ncbi:MULTISPECIES: hypothetical protein [unclassified Streptomyces]|uniref:hypothetical protein n=1 Tax=unclassified Streptomyces TaxID=2593676 RepID=UPI003327817E
MTFQHAVGEHEHTVTLTQVEVLDAVGAGRELGQPEGWSTSQVITSTAPSRIRKGQG